MMEKDREVGDEAVWSLTTAKPGNGIHQLRDDNLDTYWQSDGGQPHLINIQFHRKMTISKIALYLDYKLDESYTPKKIAIRTGSTFHDLIEIHNQEFQEPSGWIHIPLFQFDENRNKVSLRAHFVQVCIVAMHQSGRDTHLRQVKIFSPRQSTTIDLRTPEPSTVEFSAFSCIR